VIERLFLHRIQLQSCGAPIAQLQQPSGLVFADEAETRLPLADVAMPRTQIAVQASVGHSFPPAREVSSGIEDRQHLSLQSYISSTGKFLPSPFFNLHPSIFNKNAPLARGEVEREEMEKAAAVVL